MYTAGLAALDELGFAALEPAAQDGLLRAWERGEGGDVAEGFSAAAFFQLLRANVVEGLFADPRHGGNRDFAGWRWLGFPEEIALYAIDEGAG